MAKPADIARRGPKPATTKAETDEKLKELGRILRSGNTTLHKKGGMIKQGREYGKRSK